MTKRADVSGFAAVPLYFRYLFTSGRLCSVYVYTQDSSSIYIYVYTSVLLCISMHTESGYDSEVDPIVKLIWSKVCITISITISITNLTTIVA